MLAKPDKSSQTPNPRCHWSDRMMDVRCHCDGRGPDGGERLSPYTIRRSRGNLLDQRLQILTRFRNLVLTFRLFRNRIHRFFSTIVREPNTFVPKEPRRNDATNDRNRQFSTNNTTGHLQSAAGQLPLPPKVSALLEVPILLLTWVATIA